MMPVNDPVLPFRLIIDCSAVRVIPAEPHPRLDESAVRLMPHVKGTCRLMITDCRFGNRLIIAKSGSRGSGIDLSLIGSLLSAARVQIEPDVSKQAKNLNSNDVCNYR